MLITNTRAMPRQKYAVMTQAGRIFSGHWLAVPYSQCRYPVSDLVLGNVTIRLDHRKKTASGNIPESWFVDLSEDVQDLSEV